MTPWHKMISVICITLACLLGSNYAAAEKPCAPFTAEYGIVCACNATYCDNGGSLPDLAPGEYAIITTSESGQRFNVTNGTTTLSQIPHDIVDDLFPSVATSFKTLPTFTYITIDPRITYQEMEGFGGSFTDAAGLNILNISSAAQNNLFKSYYGASGLDYNLGRVPIGGTDFSLHAYAYNEYPINDTNLANFTLSEEDYTLKIPLIKRAKELASDEIRLYATTWSPPAWMKTNNELYGYSKLLPEFYHSYALYHLKFLQEYYKDNITIYSLSTGNEPVTSALGDFFTTNSLGWAAKEQAQWVINHFGPVIKGSEFPDTKIYILGELTPFVNTMLPILLEDEAILKYVDGVSLHWYADTVANIADIDKVFDLLGNISIINTEASVGEVPGDLGIKIGDWGRAEFYLGYILQKLNHNVSGWIDWNLAVNLEGGPTWNNATIDSFVVVDAETDQFFKTPMYYAFGHISKYVPRGSVRVASYAINQIPNVAFKRPDGLIVLVAMNNGTVDQILSVDDVSTGQLIKYTMEANSIATVVYNPENFKETASINPTRTQTLARVPGTSVGDGTTEQILSVDDVSTGQFIKYTMEANSIATIVYNPENFKETFTIRPTRTLTREVIISNQVIGTSVGIE